MSRPATPPAMEPGTEELQEATITSTGVVLDDPKKTSANGLGLFIKHMTNFYRTLEEEGQDLWLTFNQDFNDWDEASFKRADKVLIQVLRNLLYDRGVFTPKDKTSVYMHIVRLMDQPTCPEWPANVQKPKKKSSHVDTASNSNSSAPSKLAPGDNFNTPGSNTPGSPASIRIETPTGTATPPDTTQRQYQRSPFQKAPADNSKAANALANYKETNLSREINSLNNLYTEDKRYSGRTDSFDYKLEFFLTNATVSGIPSTKLHLAFLYMLRGDAANFYVNNKASFLLMDIDSLRLAFKKNFEGREYQIARFDEWQDITLQQYISRNKDKTLTESLNAMISRLRELQHCLDEKFHDESFIYQKILTACESEPACNIVRRKPPETIQGLISELLASTAIQDRLNRLSLSETMYTDRRYRNRESSSRSRSRYPSKLQHDSNNSSRSHDRNSTNKKRYFICKKEGCWSTNHSKEERQRSFKQYLTDVKGEEEGDSEGSTTEEENTANDQPNDSPNQGNGEVFLTSIGAIDGKAAYQKLANQATLHAVTKALPIQDNINIQGGQATCRPARRYGDNHFYGLMIDTGAAHSSSAGYSQYLALRREQNVNINTNKAGSARFKFGISDALSRGTVAVQSPIGVVEFHVIDADTLFLLCLRDLDQAGFYFNNLTNCLVSGNRQVPITRLYGHPFLTWGTSLSNAYCINTYINDSDVASSQLSEQDLRRLHRRFRHLSTTRLARLLKRSGHHFN